MSRALGMTDTLNDLPFVFCLSWLGEYEIQSRTCRVQVLSVRIKVLGFRGRL